MKFLSWGTRLHISPSFLEATANFTHPYLAPFYWQGTCFCMGRRHWPFATLKNGARERDAPWGLSLLGGCGVALLLFPWQRLAYQNPVPDAAQQPFAPAPSVREPSFPPPHALTVFQQLRNLSKVRDGAVVLIMKCNEITTVRFHTSIACGTATTPGSPFPVPHGGKQPCPSLSYQ